VYPNERGSVYVVDVDGVPAVVTTRVADGASAADVAELDAVIESIECEP